MRLILTALRHIKIFYPKTPFLFLLKADWCNGFIYSALSIRANTNK